MRSFYLMDETTTNLAFYSCLEHSRLIAIQNLPFFQYPYRTSHYLPLAVIQKLYKQLFLKLPVLNLRPYTTLILTICGYSARRSVLQTISYDIRSDSTRRIDSYICDKCMPDKRVVINHPSIYETCPLFRCFVFA